MVDDKKRLKNFSVDFEKKSGFEGEARMRGFTITIDEPEAMGGTNKGPNPIEILLASLGGCLDFTGTIVAKEMGYELEDFQMELKGGLDPRGVAGNPDVIPGLQLVKVDIKKIEGIPEDKIPEFIAQIDKRCPVDDTLCRSLEVEIRRK